MPGGHDDTSPVTYGRWQEAHAALEHRLNDAAAALETRFNDRASHLAIQIADLRGDFDTYVRAAADTATRRRDRQWTLLITLLASLALPLVVVAIVALVSSLHVR